MQCQVQLLLMPAHSPSLLSCRQPAVCVATKPNALIYTKRTWFTRQELETHSGFPMISTYASCSHLGSAWIAARCASSLLSIFSSRFSRRNSAASLYTNMERPLGRPLKRAAYLGMYYWPVSPHVVLVHCGHIPQSGCLVCLILSPQCRLSSICWCLILL